MNKMLNFVHYIYLSSFPLNLLQVPGICAMMETSSSPVYLSGWVLTYE